MSYLSYILSLPAPKLKLGGQRVILRPPLMRDYEQWSLLRENSRAFLQPKEPKWPKDPFSKAAFRDYLARQYVLWRADKAYSFVILDKQHKKLVGGININNVRRYSVQTGTLGYWMGQPYAGHGTMTKAVSLVAQFAFGTLNLNRLEAACLPDNKASIRVLEKNGFRDIGRAEAYLKIDDIWQDHQLFEYSRQKWQMSL